MTKNLVKSILIVVVVAILLMALGVATLFYLYARQENGGPYYSESVSAPE